MADTQRQTELIRELCGTKCRCGKSKARGKSFCYSCWQKLPPNQRGRLYNPVGQGYEAAYEWAVSILEEGDDV